MKSKACVSNVLTCLSLVFLVIAFASGILSVLHLYARSSFNAFFNRLEEIGINDWMIIILPIVALILSILFCLLDQKIDRRQ